MIAKKSASRRFLDVPSLFYVSDGDRFCHVRQRVLWHLHCWNSHVRPVLMVTPPSHEVERDLHVAGRLLWHVLGFSRTMTFDSVTTWCLHQKKKKSPLSKYVETMIWDYSFRLHKEHSLSVVDTRSSWTVESAWSRARSLLEDPQLLQRCDLMRSVFFESHCWQDFCCCKSFMYVVLLLLCKFSRHELKVIYASSDSLQSWQRQSHSKLNAVVTGSHFYTSSTVSSSCILYLISSVASQMTSFPIFRSSCIFCLHLSSPLIALSCWIILLSSSECSLEGIKLSSWFLCLSSNVVTLSLEWR